MMMAELSFEVLGWWLAITVVASMLSAFAYPLVSRWIANLGPSLRSLVRLVYVGSAPVAALMSVLLVTQPGLAGYFVPAHCHGDQCGVHTPVVANDSVILLGLAVTSSLVVVLLLLTLLWALRRAQRHIRVMNVLSHGAGEGHRIIDSAELLACCVGLWRPQILLSRGLTEQLQDDEVAVVLAHELAHAQRLDNLRALLLRFLTVFWPTFFSQQVTRDNRADAEQACDFAAARQVDGSEKVSSVIRKLCEMSPGNRSFQIDRRVGFDCDDAAARITELERGFVEDKTPVTGWFKAFVSLSLSWSVQIYLLTSVSHELIEWLGALAT
jgi:Zn-dependent protease with chaperone function